MNQTLILWALTSALLILAVVLLRAAFGRRMGAGLRYALWGLVLLRLLVPVQLFTVPVPELGWTQAVEAPRPSAVLVPAQTAGVPAVTGPLPDDVAMNVTTIPEPTAPHVVALDGQKLLGGLWLAGSAVTAAVFLGSNLKFARRLRRVSRPLPEERGDDVRLSGDLPVYVAENLPSPCLFGLFRPTVYVTPAAAADPDVLRHVLAHEYTHFRHGDHIWNVLRCAALAVHWWNPLVWLAAALSRRDCELACDEGALKRLGEEERFAYGRTLLSLIGARSRPADLLTCATTMTGDGKTVAQRVKRIAQAPKRWLWAAVAAVLLAGTVTVCAFGQAEPTQPPEQDPASDDVQLPAPEEADSPTPAPEQAVPLEFSFSLNEGASGVDITGLDCESVGWCAEPMSGYVNAGRHDLIHAEQLGCLTVEEPRFLGEAFAAGNGRLLSVYYPEEGPLLFLGFDEHDNGLLKPATASVYAFVDLSDGTVQEKGLSGFDDRRAGAFSDEFLVRTAQRLAPIIQDAAWYYDHALAAAPVVTDLSDFSAPMPDEGQTFVLTYKGKQTRFNGYWYHMPERARTLGTLIDLDGDGKDEIVVILPEGGGTGAWSDGLYVFDGDTLEQFDTAGAAQMILDSIRSTGDAENFYLTGPGGLNVAISKEDVRRGYEYGDIPMDDTLALGNIVEFRVETGAVHCNLPCSSYFTINYIGTLDMTLDFSRTEGFRCVKAEYTPYEDNASDLYEEAKDKMDQEKDEATESQKELDAAQAELEAPRYVSKIHGVGRGQVVSGEQLDAFLKALEEEGEKPAGGIVGYDQDQSNEFDKPKDKMDVMQYYAADSLPLFEIAFSQLDQARQSGWLNQLYSDGDHAFFSAAVRRADSSLLPGLAEQAYTDGEIAFFSTLADRMTEGELRTWLDRALADGKWNFQSMLFDRLDMDEEKDVKEEEWARRQTAEYQAVGVTMDGKNYYYQGQLVNIFLDVRSNGAFYTLDTNPAGTVNVRILRDGNDNITGAVYMTEEEAAQLLSDMRDG